MVTIQCLHCGKEAHVQTRKSKYCLECRTIVKKERERQYRIDNAEELKAKKQERQKKKRISADIKKPSVSLVDAEKMAREMNMTYGQFMARKQLEEMEKRSNGAQKP